MVPPAQTCRTDSPIAKRDFTEWVASIYVESSPSDQGAANPLPSNLSSLRMTPVEGANPDCEGEIIGPFILLQFKILHRHTAKVQAAPSQRDLGARNRLQDGPGRPINSQNMTLADSSDNRTSGGSGAAAYLQDTKPRAQWQRFHDGGKSRRQITAH